MCFPRNVVKVFSGEESSRAGKPVKVAKGKKFLPLLIQLSGFFTAHWIG